MEVNLAKCEYALEYFGSCTARSSRLTFHGANVANAAAFGFKQGPRVDRYRCVSKHVLASPFAIIFTLVAEQFRRAGLGQGGR